MKRKLSVSTVIFTFLLFAGLGILLYPTISDAVTRSRLSKEIHQYNQVTEAEKEDYAELWQAAEEYNAFLAEKEDQFILSDEEKALIPTLLNPLDNNMMGYIDIPEINIHLPIYKGTDEKQLQSGVGWWVGSSLPTGGQSTHCILTAHTGLVKAKLFTDLDQLEEGDSFTLTVLNRKMTYEIDQIRIVDPQDMTELYIQNGNDYVTLYTCYPYGVNTHRLLVRGHRTDDALEQASAPDAAAQARSMRPWQYMVIGACGVMLLAALYILTGLFFSLRKHGKYESKPSTRRNRARRSK